MNQQSAANEYLESMVLTASPARLRCLLIGKACQLCDQLVASAGPLNLEKSIHLRDVLGELLGGVQATGIPLSQHIADLYVFLLQHLTRAEENSDRKIVAEIREVLGIELGTWEQVARQLAPPIPHFPTDTGFAGSLNLNA
jgi:flagellin-specific chaperone FliS